MICSLLIRSIFSLTALKVSPEIQRAVFNRSEGFKALVNANMAVDGRESGISGFAKTANYYDEESKTVKTASISFVKSGTLMSECIVTAYTIDENGKAVKFLGPCTATNGDFKDGYILQPVITNDSQGYVCYFLHVTKQRMTFNELRKDFLTSSPTINSGLLQTIGKELQGFDTDYVMHAFVPSISTRGIMIWRQPLYCVPADPEYYACIPLISFDIASRTFSQVLIPGMLTGRENKLQDPYYSITVDNENRRIILIGMEAYKRLTGLEDEVYTYQYIPFDCEIWVNNVAGTTGLPNILPSYYSSYERDLEEPNKVIFKVNSSKRTALSESYEVKGNKKTKSSLYDRFILFYQEASLSTNDIRTTTNGIYLGNNTVTVPWQIPPNWGIDAKYETQDIYAGESNEHGVRVIKIKNTKSEPVTYEKDQVGAYFDFTSIANDNSDYSQFAKSCNIEFSVPPVFDEKGAAYYISLPLQVVYRCRQNFFSYQIKISPSEIVSEEVDELPMGPTDWKSIPVNEVFFIFDGKEPKNPTVSKEALDLKEKYSEYSSRFKDIGYFTGFNDLDYDLHKMKFIDYQVTLGLDMNSGLVQDVDIKMYLVPLPNGTRSIFTDSLDKRDSTIQGKNVESAFEFIGFDPNERSRLDFEIRKENANDNARSFARELKLSNVDLRFVKEESKEFVVKCGSLSLDNSHISVDSNSKLTLKADKSISFNMDAIDHNIGIQANSMKYELINDTLTFDGSNQGLYVLLGNEYAGISSNDPAAPDVRKIEITGTKNRNIVINKAGSYSNLHSNAHFINITYFSDSDSINGKGFPDVTLNVLTGYQKAIFNIPQAIPYLNGEQIKATAYKYGSSPLTEVPVEIVSAYPVNFSCPQIKSLDFSTLPNIINIDDYPNITLNFIASDTNAEIIFTEKGIKIRCKGRTAIINRNVAIKMTSSGFAIKLSIDPKCKNVGNKATF